MFDCPLKSKEEDRFLVPEWAKGKVVYQIFPDRFASSHEVDEKLWYDSHARGDGSFSCRASVGPALFPTRRVYGRGARILL